MRTYRLTVERTYMRRSFEEDKKEKIQRQIKFSAQSDKEAIACVEDWLRKKYIACKTHLPVGVMQVSYSFVKLEQVRDISKRCLNKIGRS